jgi:hypothetical protein
VGANLGDERVIVNEKREEQRLLWKLRIASALGVCVI